MTTDIGEGAFEDVWRVPDHHVQTGRFPGYVGAVRIRGRVEIHASGRTAVEVGSMSMAEDTLFRIASITKLIGGALTMSLVEHGLLHLDDPIDRWLPEMSDVRVLVAPDGALDETAELRQPITIRHLLTFTCGWGAVLEQTPLQAAMMERQLYPGPIPRPFSGDEYVARMARLPLAFQPGEGWLYDSGTDILGVLLARATGSSLEDLVSQRITGPLGMTSTTFGRADPDRLATAYRPGANGLEILDPPAGAFTGTPVFAELSSGLVSTASDLLRFMCAMADGGEPVLRTDSVAKMTTDALTDAQRSRAVPILGELTSWGLATAVDVDPTHPWMTPGRWGWNGGTGTTAYVDATRDTVGVLLTQRAMTGPLDSFDDFWAAVAAAA